MAKTPKTKDAAKMTQGYGTEEQTIKREKVDTAICTIDVRICPMGFVKAEIQVKQRYSKTWAVSTQLGYLTNYDTV